MLITKEEKLLRKCLCLSLKREQISLDILATLGFRLDSDGEEDEIEIQCETKRHERFKGILSGINSQR